tara:strand:+ start:139 stop:354 length:216 start_codon:yes stop_codon:yes gene_type:complete
MDSNYDPESELIQEIMNQFQEIWPKVVWYDPNLEAYEDLIRSVYARGMINTFTILQKKLATEVLATGNMVH